MREARAPGVRAEDAQRLVGGYAGGGLAQLLAETALRRVFALFLMVAALDLLRR